MRPSSTRNHAAVNPAAHLAQLASVRSRTTNMPIRKVAATNKKVTASMDDRARTSRRSDLAALVLETGSWTCPSTADVTAAPTGPVLACGDQATGRGDGGSGGTLPTLGGGTGGGAAGGWCQAGPAGGVGWLGCPGAKGCPATPTGIVPAGATPPYSAAGAETGWAAGGKAAAAGAWPALGAPPTPAIGRSPPTLVAWGRPSRPIGTGVPRIVGAAANGRSPPPLAARPAGAIGP